MFFHVALHLESSQDIGVMAGEWSQAQMAMLAEFGRGLSPAAMRHQAQLVLLCRSVSQGRSVLQCSYCVAALICIASCLIAFTVSCKRSSRLPIVTETYLSVT